jgi:hypothetical protein
MGGRITLLPFFILNMAKGVEDKEQQFISCLRNEKICIRFIPRQSHMVTDPRHILYGGMANDSIKTFVVPKLNTGTFVNVLTNSEMAFLESYLGMEKGTMSVYKRENNFWSDANPQGINQVKLRKQDNYLDLSLPEDYIRYKILLSNKDFIAPSLKALEDRPKATYQFVVIEGDESVKNAKRAMNATRECYMEFGKIENDIETLMCIVELIDGRNVAPNTSLDFLQTKIDSFIQSNPKLFLKTVKDETLPTKVLIRRSINAGNIVKRGDYLYLKKDGKPLCGDNEEPVLSVAVKYLNNPKHQDIKLGLEALLNQK